MKTLIITIVVLLLNISGLVGQQSIEEKKLKEYLENYSTTTLQDIRNSRFIYIPKYSYKEDSDLEVIGALQYNSHKIAVKKKTSKLQIEIHRNKQQPIKFKSTYLDFTILQEENIS
jgi:hypothetical protein